MATFCVGGWQWARQLRAMRHLHDSTPLSLRCMGSNLSRRQQRFQKQYERDWEDKYNQFVDFYEPMFGTERWQSSLLPALERPTRHCALVNGFVTEIPVFENSASLPSIPGIYLSGPPQQDGKKSFPDPSTMVDPETDLLMYYPMDASSLVPVQCLDVQPHHNVLDMCSAPGGKALGIIQLSADGLPRMLICNDPSNARRHRLERVLEDYLPDEVRQKHTRVIGTDMASSKKVRDFPEAFFDRILLDAPCTAERHFLHDKDPDAWSPHRSQKNSKRQAQLLQSAIRLTKPNGGRIVYSTCSLSQVENDDVVEKTLKKHSNVLKSVEVDISLQAVKTTYGWHILPDQSDGWGPMYVAVLEKK